MARFIDAYLLAQTYLDVAQEEHLTGLVFVSPEDVANTIINLSEEFEDVVPVVRAHKVKQPNGHFHCSNCGYGLHCEQSPFCWHCGAKMDEEVE